MKNFTIAMMLGIVAATTGLVLKSAPAYAANLSFTGNLTNPNDTPSFFFTADGTSTVTIRSYSWGGGTNAAATVIGSGGFDPILTLFNANNGNFILEREDISAFPLNLDFQLVQQLPAGDYRAVISAFANFANSPNFSDGFGGAGDFNNRTSAYAFDILNVNAVTTAVPEPTTFIGTVVAGVAVVSLKRKLSSSKKN